MGGGAMRAAAKVAGITVGNGGLRGFTSSEHHPFFSATRSAISSRGALAEDVKPAASLSLGGVQPPSPEIEDWVFAGGEEEAILGESATTQRVVVVGAPTHQEAKAATSELAVALQNLQAEKKTSENAVSPSVPAHAIKAFTFLHESTAAQNVVASIASDPNVWNAVLHNQELQKFVQSQRQSLGRSTMDQSSESDYAESEAEDSALMDIVQKVKVNVVDMMSSLSDYFKDFFGPQGKASSLLFARVNGSTATAEAVMEASFMGLAVMAIMVILLNRA
ncbi:hypothetical protein ACP275_13G090900 [Erythranthe tilingii]